MRLQVAEVHAVHAACRAASPARHRVLVRAANQSKEQEEGGVPVDGSCSEGEVRAACGKVRQRAHKAGQSHGKWQLASTAAAATAAAYW